MRYTGAMSRESLIILLGIIVLFTPHLGIPSDWKMYLFSGSGLLLIIFGYGLRRMAFRRRLERSGLEFGTDSFMESSGNQDDAAAPEPS